MKAISAVVSTVIMTLMLQTSAQAWGSIEHQIIARIAWARMTPQARANALALLRAAPADSGLGSLFSQDARPLATRQLEFFLRASFWPDTVRNPARPEQRQKYNCQWWHFSDLHWREQNGAPVDVPDLQSLPLNNLLERLPVFQAMLADTTQPLDHRAVGVAWVLHLVGDIHQPLHCSSRVSPEFPAGDLGGNRFRLGASSQTRARSLHAYWDTILSTARPMNEEPAHYIERLAADLMNRYPEAQLRARLAPGQVETWGRECLQLAKTVPYNGVQEGRAPSAAYHERALRTAEEEIALAGYRLAYLLNDTVGSDATTRSLSTARAQQQAIKDVETEVGYDFACAEADLYHRFASLEQLVLTLPNGNTAEGYDAEAVKALIVDTKASLLDSLERRRLYGLKAYVDEKFPLATDLPVYRTAPGRTQRDDATPPLHHGADSDGWATLKSLAVAAVETARSFIRSSAANAKVFTLHIITEPSAANVTISAPDGRQIVQTSSNINLNDFWRGIYNLRINRPQGNYLPIVQERVNLWSGVTVIHCRLIKREEASEALFCQLQ